MNDPRPKRAARRSDSSRPARPSSGSESLASKLDEFLSSPGADQAKRAEAASPQRGKPSARGGRERAPNDPVAAFVETRKPRSEGAQSPKEAVRIVQTFAAPPNAKADMDALLDAVDEAFPLDVVKRRALKGMVLDLWRDLTADRAERPMDYLADPIALSAYIRYFMAWNVVRLVPVLAALKLDLADEATILDVGSGPLAMPIALWIAHPELRGKRIRVICVDRAKRALETGASIFAGLRERTGGPEDAWLIETRRAVFPDVGEHVRADLVTAANVFTEFFWKDRRPLGVRAVELVRRLTELATPGGGILVVEPGEPRSGAMLAALREAAVLGGALPESPCPHAKACPMPGAFGGLGEREDDDDRPTRARSALAAVVQPRRRPKMPWCHMPVPLDHAPKRLAELSETVGLPKERLTVSWLLLRQVDAEHHAAQTQGSASPKGSLRLRLISDKIRLPGGAAGRYACSEQGYTLAVGRAAAIEAGALVDYPKPGKKERDEKSGAVIASS